ncbi:MAG: 30S ribosome-binding factor RbfA [Bacteroidales bacterium]
MESQRQKRINKLLQKDLGEILQRESPNKFLRAMITVTQVKVTSDLSIARIYISIFGADPGKVIEQVKLHTSEIRKQLGLRVKNQLRHVPELQFFIDDSLDYIENIEKLLKK